MFKKIARLILVELPVGLALMGSLLYFYVTPETAAKMALYFAALLVVLGMADTVVHEMGHVACGLLFGAPVMKVRIGAGPRLASWRMGTDGPVIALHLFLGFGYVEFRSLPLARWKRIVMYAGGVSASLLFALVAWFLLPADFGWMRTETVVGFMLFSFFNLFGTAPKGAHSDGDAIRGLLAYR